MTEQTDRELLEMAAKAAGIRIEWDGPPDKWQPMYYEGKTYHAFDPLTDDGDALRLAVKLEIDLWFGCGGLSAHGLAMDTEEDYGRDPYAATRRAITRAAAEIGKAMP